MNVPSALIPLLLLKVLSQCLCFQCKNLYHYKRTDVSYLRTISPIRLHARQELFVPTAERISTRLLLLISKVFTPSPFDIEITFRLALAAFVGMLIGLERRCSHRPPGVRTLSLVALGASTFTLVSAYGFSGGDPARIAASVASGVGFLGAGTITHPKRHQEGGNVIDSDVRGLTTAAAIWITAGLGMASGAGLYFLTFAATLISCIVLKLNDMTKYSRSKIKQIQEITKIQYRIQPSRMRSNKKYISSDEETTKSHHIITNTPTRSENSEMPAIVS